MIEGFSRYVLNENKKFETCMVYNLCKKVNIVNLIKSTYVRIYMAIRKHMRLLKVIIFQVELRGLSIFIFCSLTFFHNIYFCKVKKIKIFLKTRRI